MNIHKQSINTKETHKRNPCTGVQIVARKKSTYNEDSSCETRTLYPVSGQSDMLHRRIHRKCVL